MDLLFYNFSVVRWHRCCESTLMENKDLFTCTINWWPGDTRRQGLSCHCFDVVILKYFFFHYQYGRAMEIFIKMDVLCWRLFSWKNTIDSHPIYPFWLNAAAVLFDIVLWSMYLFIFRYFSCIFLYIFVYVFQCSRCSSSWKSQGVGRIFSQKTWSCHLQGSCSGTRGEGGK